MAHEPWQLQPSEARIELNRIAPLGQAFDGVPLLHFSRTVEVRVQRSPVARALQEGVRECPRDAPVMHSLVVVASNANAPWAAYGQFAYRAISAGPVADRLAAST